MLPRVYEEQEAPAGILLGLCQSTLCNLQQPRCEARFWRSWIGHAI